MDKYFHMITSIKDTDVAIKLFEDINGEKKEHNYSIIDIKEVIEFERLSLYEKNHHLSKSGLKSSISEKLENLFLFGRLDNMVGILKINSTKELLELKSLNGSLYENISANSVYLDNN